MRYQQATALRPLKAGEFATGAGTGNARTVSQTDGRTLLMGGVGVGVAGCNAPAGETGTGTGNPSPLALLLKGHFNRLWEWASRPTRQEPGGGACADYSMPLRSASR